MVQDRAQSGFPVESSEQLWDGAVFGLREDRVQLPGGDRPVVRQYLTHPGAVGIVPVRFTGSDPLDAELLLLRQYRHPVRAELWEIPAGLLDHPGEEPLAAAKRELREEADLGARTWSVLVDLFTSPGASEEALRIFLATDLFSYEEAFARAEEEAQLVPHWVDLRSAVAGVLAGDLHSPSAIAGILATQATLLQPDYGRREPASPWLRKPRN